MTSAHRHDQTRVNAANVRVAGHETSVAAESGSGARMEIASSASRAGMRWLRCGDDDRGTQTTSTTLVPGDGQDRGDDHQTGGHWKRERTSTSSPLVTERLDRSKVAVDAEADARERDHHDHQHRLVDSAGLPAAPIQEPHERPPAQRLFGTTETRNPAADRVDRSRSG